MDVTPLTPLLRDAACAVFALALVGCAAAPERNAPLPAEFSDVAEVPGIPEARVWGDGVPDNIDKWFEKSNREVLEEFGGIYGRAHDYLCISGGGPNGAFGAGLICGWTQSGVRPEFTLVSGISTGALIAPFAFLGPDYDDELREIYTSYSTQDLARTKSLLSIVRGDSALDTSPLRDKVREYYDQEVLDAIAVETRRGRSLLIGTTNIDAQRPVIWNIGKIAESDAPNRLEVFHDVIVASAAIPGVFTPVYMEVEANGERYDELHVDGGATNQLFLYPVGVDWARVLDLLQVSGRPTVYTIRNSKLSADYRIVEPRVLDITAATVGALMRTSGYGDMYRLYIASLRDGLDYRLAAIPESFDSVPNEAFDKAYMRALFDHAFEMARQGYPWETAPPGVQIDAGSS